MCIGWCSSQKVTVLLSLVAINIAVIEVFLVVEEQGFRCPCLDPPLHFIYKVHGMPCSRTQKFRTQRQQFFCMSNEGLLRVLTYVYENNSWKLHQKLLLVRPETPTRRKRRRRIKKHGSCKAFCITRKRNKVEHIQSSKSNLVIN